MFFKLVLLLCDQLLVLQDGPTPKSVLFFFFYCSRLLYTCIQHIFWRRNQGASLCISCDLTAINQINSKAHGPLVFMVVDICLWSVMIWSFKNFVWIQYMYPESNMLPVINGMLYIRMVNTSSKYMFLCLG